jgi:hypothetical protein
MRRVIGWIGFGAASLWTATAGPAQRAPQALPSTVREQSNDAVSPIYIVAHQDDWQIFMGDEIAKALSAGGRATFIYITAGDDGRDSTYWLTREQAALESTRIASGAYARRSQTMCDTTRITAHVIRRCTLGRTTSYFLRLPDGKRNGAGFARYGYQSLRKLRRKTITSLNAVDRSAVYRSWNDVFTTLDALATTASLASKPVLYSTDPSIAINPHDHFDHRIAGLLVEEMRKGHGWRARYYVGYALASRAANRSAEETQQKTATFRAYDGVMIRADPSWSAYTEHPKFYSDCMQRTYARAVPRTPR